MLKLFKNNFLVFIWLALPVLNCCCQQQAKYKQDTVYTYKTPGEGGSGKVYFGREIAQVMSADGAAWLERSERQQEENVNKAISLLPLKVNSVVADIGAGTGYYTFKIAPDVSAGKVYAVEVQDEFINALQQRKQQLQLNNIIITKGSFQSPNLPDTTIDLAIMVDVYHELSYPHEMLQSIYKSLKPGGKLLLLEYRAEDASIPIKRLHKLSIAQANKELAANGFRLYERNESLPIQHFLLYQKIN